MTGMRLLLALIAMLVLGAPSDATDAAFQNWLAAQWPAAHELGVSRATFDAATRGLEPDLSLPDLAIPGVTMTRRLRSCDRRLEPMKRGIPLSTCQGDVS